MTDETCRGCGYSRRFDDPPLIDGLCVRAHHDGDPSCWSRAARKARAVRPAERGA